MELQKKQKEKKEINSNQIRVKIEFRALYIKSIYYILFIYIFRDKRIRDIKYFGLSPYILEKKKGSFFLYNKYM